VSQVATKRKLNIRNEHVKVTGRFHEQGSVLRGDAAGFCDGFDIQIRIESEESPEKIAELIRIARQMCFTESALVGNTPLTVSQLLNQQPLQI
jgi:hypothetical protein